MGAAATRRGDAVIARQAARIYTGEQVAHITRDLDHEILRLTNIAATQAAQLEKMEEQIAQMQLLRHQVAELQAHLDQATERAHHNAELWRAELRERQHVQGAHNKLIGIVRANVSPERWHEWRSQYTETQEPAQP